MDGKEKVIVKIVTDTSELDDICAKAERLKSCLQEAMELADSIASLDLDLRINAVIDGKSTELARVTAEFQMNGSVAVRTGNINTVLFKMFLRGFFKNVLYIGIPRDLDIFTHISRSPFYRLGCWHTL